MKELIENFKLTAKDKGVLAGMIGLLVMSVALIVTVAVNVKVSSLQIWFRYVSFGENYYNEKWYYMLVFAGMGVITGVLHVMLTAKIFANKGRGMAILFLAVSVMVVALTFMTLGRILDINEGIN